MRIFMLLSVLACLVSFSAGNFTGYLYCAVGTERRIKELEDTLWLMNQPEKNTIFRLPVAKSVEQLQ